MADHPPGERSTSLDRIWAGMPVVDVSGTLVGSVKYVQPGDSAAVEAGQPIAEDENLASAFARALPEVEPQVDASFATRLLRDGFLKVRGAGLMDHDRYVAADQIATADEDQVLLLAAADELVAERERWV